VTLAAGAAVAVAGAFFYAPLFAAGGLFSLFSLYFFRDPERTIRILPGQIVAPADGKVVAIDEVQEKEFMGARCKRISIFLSIFDVHINRAPVGGRVEMIKYTPGRFALANTLEASAMNENNLIGIDGDNVRVVVRQIAGAVARRIICYCKPSQLLQSGERIGMIRFGSRTELYLPLNCEVLVSVCQRVKGGISLVGAYDVTIEKKA
jgi:phosphatidylserine decarboxylase